ncbi:MAG TPA: sigma-70 family RNA polymerase sigma factor [Bryobacteraceae bacterium]|jgi:RNA polymerase sigma-70 factor (ECF subfamily)|nr:sigma-70 family RNA polymerase sigma factor [Bryobacteraceae bacterium]
MVPANSPESELIERIKRREPEGLTAVYDRYATAAYSVFLRITRDAAVAEDLLQELFFRIWNRSRHFDETKGALGVWILAIARNMAIDYVRSAQARFSSRLLPLGDINPLFLSSRSKEVEGVIDRGAVKAALSGLNANEKRVLEMAYFDGLTQTEIAAKLDEPLGTVKSWTRSALGRLRSAMKAGAAT